jgi:phosphoglycolate phosphatase-like HAD superfamily hydrolase
VAVGGGGGFPSDARATLLLFDVDGTLLRGATRTHRDAVHRALQRVHGIDPTRVGLTLAPAGRTDGEIARALLLDAGVSAQRIDERADEVRMECCRAYAELCDADLSAYVIDGIPALLAWLAPREDVRLALLTGNYEPVARLKLLRAGIGGAFAAGQGAFGSDAEDRAALPAIARRRAGSPGAPHSRARTVVIGDTPRDIACARADGVRCVAVATGPFAADALGGADAVARDPGELRVALSAILAGA